MRKVKNFEEVIEKILDAAEKRLHESEKVNHEYNYALMEFIHDVMRVTPNNFYTTYRITAEEAEKFLQNEYYECVHNGKYIKYFLDNSPKFEAFFWLASAPR